MGKKVIFGSSKLVFHFVLESEPKIHIKSIIQFIF